MNKNLIERSAIAILITITMTLSYYTININENSFKDVARIIYAVDTEVGNLREKPSTASKVIVKMNSGDHLRLISSANKTGGWYKARHLTSLMEGYVHKSILSKYVYLGYYDEFIIGKSLLELRWD
ncbi:SH3 domain-containing protein [Bacteriovoracaceae bacterium]|nr:SH3 domain-containing protein [Bacteriovoracaceae bacterium]